MPTGIKMTKEMFLKLLSEKRPNIIMLDEFDDYTAYKRFLNTNNNYEFTVRCNSILKKVHNDWHVSGVPKSQTQKHRYTDEEYEELVRRKNPNVILLQKNHLPKRRCLLNV